MNLPRWLAGKDPRRTAIRAAIPVASAYLVFGHILMPVRGVGISMTPTIDPDRMTAQVCLTAQARYGDGTGARELEARELDITLRKQEGDRVVSSVTLVRTLEPLTPR